MNELVDMLAQRPLTVQANRRDPSPAAIKSRIDMGYVHILFEDTGTEIGIRLHPDKCTLTEADWERGAGALHLEGYATLNFEKVRCVADIGLPDGKGTAMLVRVGEEEYGQVIKPVVN